jgi:hypothetical protein
MPYCGTGSSYPLSFDSEGTVSADTDTCFGDGTSGGSFSSSGADVDVLLSYSYWWWLS